MLGQSDLTRTSIVRSLTARELPLAVEGYMVHCREDPTGKMVSVENTILVSILVFIVRDKILW